MRSLKTALAVTLLMTCGLAAPALAGDCNDVRFELTNGTGAKIKVKSITIKGNDGTWTEDIPNRQIETNAEYTTPKQRLNKLDSGREGDFTVNYDRWDAPNNKWEGKSQKFSDLKCTDGKLFKFNVTRK